MQTLIQISNAKSICLSFIKKILNLKFFINALINSLTFYFTFRPYNFSVDQKWASWKLFAHLRHFNADFFDSFGLAMWSSASNPKVYIEIFFAYKTEWGTKISLISRVGDWLWESLRRSFVFNNLDFINFVQFSLCCKAKIKS